MLGSVVHQLETVLYSELLFCSGFTDQDPVELGLSEIPWDELLDNAVDDTIGHSFVDKLFQHDGGASRGWLIRKIWQSTRLRDAWVRSVEEERMELDGKQAFEYGLCGKGTGAAARSDASQRRVPGAGARASCHPAPEYSQRRGVNHFGG